MELVPQTTSMVQGAGGPIEADNLPMTSPFLT
jgi:hypothetical protein